MILAAGLEFCSSSCRIFHNSKLDTQARSERLGHLTGGVA